ncbi:MAG TPA: HDOD domain-containing protein [Fimbriimonas sp.]|nr:HDOD domain-containing protein [Fimbriimonas sp.]
MDLRTIELKIARGENLPVLPQAAHAALRAAEDSGSSTREIERLIEQDPALTAKVLRVVNSPIYAISNVTSVGRALAILGLNRTRSVILAVSFQNLTAERYESQGFNMLAYWRHSLAVANAAKIIAAIVAPFLSEEIYCMGMLHDIGLIVMAKFCPGELDAVIRLAQCARVPLFQAEPKIIPFTHAQLGGILAEKWCLGPKVKEAIEGHHNAESPQKGSPAAILLLADVLAHQAGFTNQAPEVEYELTEQMLDAVNLSAEQTTVIKDVMCAEVEKIERVLAVAPRRAA